MVAGKELQEKSKLCIQMWLSKASEAMPFRALSKLLRGLGLMFSHAKKRPLKRNIMRIADTQNYC